MDYSPMMGGFGVWQLLFMLIWVVILVIPIARILNRMGFSRIWTVLAFIPLINLIFLWVLAYSNWPIEDKES